MKKIFRKIVLLILNRNAKQYLKKYKPSLIVVCGQKYRTNIKEDLVEAYKNTGIVVRGTFKGYNSAIGIPLSILNLQAGFTSIIKWFKLILSSFKALNEPNPPKVLVLEIVVDNAKEMENLLKIIKPSIVIFTDFDASLNENDLNQAYKKLVSVVGEGTLLINSDFEEILNLVEGRGSSGSGVTFGFNVNADIKASEVKELDNGQEFLYTYNGNSKKILVPRFAEQSIYSSIISNFLLSLKL
jgi:UDP-N-acetylmuramyl pentapeptide synthase